jgi:hypothetical protein
MALHAAVSAKWSMRLKHFRLRKSKSKVRIESVW